MEKEINKKTLTQLAEDLRQGQFSSEELTQYYLERIDLFDEKINAFITVTREEAIQQARAADKALAAGKSGPLTGVPIAHKDIFCTRGIKTIYDFVSFLPRNKTTTWQYKHNIFINFAMFEYSTNDGVVKCFSQFVLRVLFKLVGKMLLNLTPKFGGLFVRIEQVI